MKKQGESESRNSEAISKMANPTHDPKSPDLHQNRKQDEEKENERPFAKYIREMEEIIEYVEREFQRDPVHIEIPDEKPQGWKDYFVAISLILLFLCMAVVIVVVVVVAAVAVIVILVVRRQKLKPVPSEEYETPPEEPDILAALKDRYAKGEITKEEYEKLKSILEK